MRLRWLTVLTILILFAVSVVPGAIHAQPDPVELVSRDNLFAYLTDLTSIQPHSGWRNSASSGEQEAVDYVAETLADMAYLVDLGLTTEQQEFNVYAATEIWQSSLVLSVSGTLVSVPADALRGPRWDLAQAARFDSDGVLNDSEPAPVVAAGDVELVLTRRARDELRGADMQGTILVVDYALVDRVVLGKENAISYAEMVMATRPEAIILVTSFSNVPGKSNGAFVGDVSAFNQVDTEHNAPIVFTRLEDLDSAGITGWDDLALIESAEVTWDADVFAPGQSRNLIAHIPGADSDHAVILGAHIDSPNSPGAMDDGSGSAVLLEVARVLNEAQAQPPVDLYLVWFGSEELGLYGSAHFAATHQELLDRTLGLLNVDCLTHPLNGLSVDLKLEMWPYGRFGDETLYWPDYLADNAAAHDIDVLSYAAYWPVSDSTSFAGFGVPQANLIYADDMQMETIGGVHYAGHLHSPYDTVEVASAYGDVLTDMARIAVMAALQTGQDQPVLRTMPEADGRVLILATHTEATTLSPAVSSELGMAMIAAGLDVDMIPFGQTVSESDLADASLVLVTPPYDYAESFSGATQVDVSWTDDEIARLTAYVEQGGLLILTNSANSLDFYRRFAGENEDWHEQNALGAAFGVTYEPDVITADRVYPQSGTLLTKDVIQFDLLSQNGIPFTITEGRILAEVGDQAVLAQVPFGEGEVIVVADWSLFAPEYAREVVHLAFWRNLSAYARMRLGI